MPIFQIHLRAKRLPNYYVKTVMFPICALTLSSWCTFAANPTQLEDRMEIILTLISVTTAFRFLSTNAIPKINYSTLMDNYMLGQLLFQVSFGGVVLVCCGVSVYCNSVVAI